MRTKQTAKKQTTKKPRRTRTQKRMFLVADDSYEKTFFKGKHLTTIHRIYNAKTGNNKSLDAMIDEKNGSRRRVRTAMIKKLVGDKPRSIEKKTEFPYGYNWKTPEMVAEKKKTQRKKKANLDSYFTPPSSQAS